MRLTRCLLLLSALLWPCLAWCEEAADTGCCTFDAEGRIEYDYNRYYSDVADLGDGEDVRSDLRRAELGFKGSIEANLDWLKGKPIEWAAGYNLKTSTFTDAFVKYGTGGSWHLRLGKFKQPLGLEQLSSSRTADFISQAAVTNLLALSRQIGTAYDHTSPRTGITVSFFGRTRLEDDEATDPDSGYALRGYWTPVRGHDQVMHLGVSHARFGANEDQVRLRVRPNADLTDVRLVDTGIVDNVEDQASTGLELMWLSGAMKLQSDILQSSVRRRDGVRDFTAHGGYLSGVWNLTGEAWAYRNGVPVTPTPRRTSHGVWQVGVRYDWVDLDDGELLAAVVPGAAPAVDGVLGGTMDVWTAGVSVYWGSHLKLMLNYVSVRSNRYDPAIGAGVRDDPQILAGRVQLNW